ncbi:MAG: energy-coupling factor ABC transporter permease [Actinobacteria bacterium]|nr:energy-coupling factor ABC transporter permease [Actinomycetota bacterium]
MHMADALISPAVGGTMWVATGATAAYAATRVRKTLDQSRIPLMGIAGAFVFAGQMLNFTIPGTGSSGHLGGALILAMLLGPEAAFLVMASILAVQALFFADGGLLALGCNIFNLGFFPAFIAYPFIYKPIVGSGARPPSWRFVVGSIVAAVVGLQLGAFAVVLQTTFSGVSELPFGTFVLLMLPIHLAIGVVEGLITAVVVLFVRQAQPELLARTAEKKPIGSLSVKPVLIGLAVAAVLAAGVVSWFASSYSDGLEWSIAKATGTEQEPENSSGAHETAAGVQEKTAFMPDYAFKEGEAAEDAGGGAEAAAADEPAWPAVDAGTSVAGLAGAGIVLVVAAIIGLALYKRPASGAKPGA